MIFSILKSFRPRQWTKNGILFAGLFFGHKASQAQWVFKAFLAAGFFCVISSSMYLLNDVIDAPLDKKHPDRSQRPIAKGELSRGFGLGLSLVILFIFLPLSAKWDFHFFAFLLVYTFIMVLYSLWLKHILFIDLIVISLGFVLRAAAGAEVVRVSISPWLILCAFLLALFLAIGKRRGEMVKGGIRLESLKEIQAASGKKSGILLRPVLSEYSIHLLDNLLIVVTASIIVSYSLYTFFQFPINPSTGMMGIISRSNAMMASTLFVIYGLFRYHYLLQEKKMGFSPEEVLLRDRPLQINLLLWGLWSFLCLYR